MQGHVVISGTGRAGTTLLVQLLTRCGVDTGFSEADLTAGLFAHANAGLERDLRRGNAPYLVKSPDLCDHIGEVLAAGIRIDHAIIPLRDIEEAAASRARVAALHKRDRGINGPGGLWSTSRSVKQKAILAGKLGDLLVRLVAADVPITFLSFPRFASDADYCYAKLEPIFGFDRAIFDKAFAASARPGEIHTFQGVEPVTFFRTGIIGKVRSALARVRGNPDR